MNPRITPHPLEDPSEIEKAIRGGNASLFDVPQDRDLAISKKEYWETRPSPDAPHHWTEAEFNAHLAKYHYPGCTLRNREQGRIQQIRRALVHGQYVPPEVLADSATTEAIEDALMDIRCAISQHKADQQQKEGQAQFERDIGLWTSQEAYEKGLELLLVATARASASPIRHGTAYAVTGTAKRFTLEGISTPLVVVLKTPDDHNRHHMKQKWLEIRDARYNDVSLWGGLMRIDFHDLEVMYCQLLKQDKVKLDEVRSVLGELWTPYTRVYCSAPLAA